MEAVHAVSAAQYGLAGTKQIPGKTHARIVEEQTTSGTRERRRGIHLIPFNSRESESVYRSASASAI